MAIRNKLLVSFESLLRVPPLLVIDEVFRTSFGFGGRPFNYGGSKQSSDASVETIILSAKGHSSPATHGSLESEFTYSSLGTFLKEMWVWGMDVIRNDSVSSNSSQSKDVAHSLEDLSKLTDQLTEDLIFAGQIFFSLILFVVALVMFTLATENLVKLYTYIVSFLTTFAAYSTPSLICGPTVMELFMLFSNLTFRTLLATLFFACQPQSNTSFFTRTLMFSIFYVTGVAKLPPTLFAFITFLLHYELIKSIPKVYSFLKISWAETKRVQNEYGLSHLIQVESGRIRINAVFRLFWMTRAAYDAFHQCCDEPISLMLRSVMIHGTETFTGILGLTVTVSAICHQIGDFLLWLLYFGSNNEVDLNRFGSISTVLFFILSLQSGLTSLDPEKRLDRLMKNIALLGTALFHALHQLLAPLLHAFRSFQAVQIRAATLSLVFLCFSFGLTLSLLKWTTLSTWSLAVLALAIEFKIKVVISLIISLVVYLSQLVQYPDILEKVVSFCRRILPHSVMHFFDQKYDQISHEDMVFYLKTGANITEFLTGIFLFLNAVWIFLFESTSAIRAIGMSIHAYFNIWCEAQKGFRIYCQRKTASKKIMSLHDATEEQLRMRDDDVCSICYESFESAKVTNCGHLFHAVCLRKWLYVQNTCPMCHEILYKEEVSEEPHNIPTPVADVQQIDLHRDFGDDSDNGVRVGARNRVGVVGTNVVLANRRGRFINFRRRRRNTVGEAGPVRRLEIVEFWNEDGNETDTEDNDDTLHDGSSDDSSESFEELENMEEVWRRNRANEENRGENNRAGEGVLEAANGRGLVLFL